MFRCKNKDLIIWTFYHSCTVHTFYTCRMDDDGPPCYRVVCVYSHLHIALCTKWICMFFNYFTPTFSPLSNYIYNVLPAEGVLCFPTFSSPLNKGDTCFYLSSSEKIEILGPSPYPIHLKAEMFVTLIFMNKTKHSEVEHSRLPGIST